MYRELRSQLLLVTAASAKSSWLHLQIKFQMIGRRLKTVPAFEQKELGTVVVNVPSRAAPAEYFHY